MSKFEALDKVGEDIRRCYRCGYCRDMARDLTGTFQPCPVRENLRHEHFCARGRNTIARGIMDGNLEFSYGLRDVVYTCLNCAGCQDACSLIDWAKVDSPAITRAMREELHALGMTPRKILNVHRVKETQSRSDGKATCQIACPIDQDVPAYVGLIVQGRYGEALDVIRRANPLPSVCGRACTHPCEAACRQAEIGEPISIMRLKRFCVDYELAHGKTSIPSKADVSSKQHVAVVGSGPAGISAANYLIRHGINVTVFEKMDQPGGMMTNAIPDFTLPKAAVMHDIEHVRALGVEIKTGVEIGKDKSLKGLLEEGFNAVLLCLGTWSSVKMGIPGENVDNVWDGLELLKRVKGGQKLSVPQSVIVTGGGKVAIDVSRTLIRSGAEEVITLYRRSKEEMPVEEESVRFALEEGVCIRESLVPCEILVSEGRVRGVKIQDVDCIEADEDGNAVAVCVEGSAREIDTQMVVFAIGQKPDLSGLDGDGLVKMSKRGTIQRDDHFRTGDLPIFVAGDAANGPTSIVDAMASGRDAAKAVEMFLQGSSRSEGVSDGARKGTASPKLELDPARIVAPRSPMPMIDMSLRQSSLDEVEKGFSESTACQEARRCLACDVERFKDLPLVQSADTLFFIGCNNTYRYPEVARAAVETLSQGGVQLTLAAKEYCCGSPAFWSGDTALAEKLRHENMALFRNMGIKKIITACSDCYEMLSHAYGLDSEGIVLEHFVQTLASLLEREKISVNGYQGTVTYHDPCQLARKGKVIGEPRTILERVSGLKLVEMQRSKEGTHCCGGGPNRLVRLTASTLADDIGKKRLAEAQETQAQALITACPWCKTHLESLDINGLKVYDFPYFIHQVVGLKKT